MDAPEIVERTTILRGPWDRPSTGFTTAARTTATRWPCSSSRPSSSSGFRARARGNPGRPLRLRAHVFRTQPDGARSGQATEALVEIDEVEARLAAAALERTSLPPEPDRVAVDAFLGSAYRRAWGW